MLGKSVYNGEQTMSPIEPKDSPYFCEDLNRVTELLNHWQDRKGFTTPKSLAEGELALAKTFLAVSELAEAGEEIRDYDIAAKSPEELAVIFQKCENEYADAIIRILNITGPLGMDMATAIARKMEVNEKRGHKHGRTI